MSETERPPWLPEPHVSHEDREARVRIEAKLVDLERRAAEIKREQAAMSETAPEDDRPMNAVELALAEHFRGMGCVDSAGVVVDPVDLEDCAGMAVEVVRFLRAGGWMPTDPKPDTCSTRRRCPIPDDPCGPGGARPYCWEEER